MELKVEIVGGRRTNRRVTTAVVKLRLFRMICGICFGGERSVNVIWEV